MSEPPNILKFMSILDKKTILQRMGKEKSIINIATSNEKGEKKTWQRPTLPRTSRSTIGEEAFHCRVRDGNVCFHFSMVTRKFTMLFKRNLSKQVKLFSGTKTIIWSSLTAY